MNIEQRIERMTKSQKDFIGVYGNQWAPRKTTPFGGTCQLCVWGQGVHSHDCVTYQVPGNWPHSSGCD